MTTYFDQYKKKVNDDDMNTLLQKKAATNPLWLTVACEELRIFGEVTKLNNKIGLLADGLVE